MAHGTKNKVNQSQGGTGHSDSESSWTHTTPDEGQATKIKIPKLKEPTEKDICDSNSKKSSS